MDTVSTKETLYYQIASSAFCVIVILSNIISAKMMPLPYFATCCIPAGLLTYPLTFLLSAFVTEIFGAKKAREMVYVTLGMNVLTLLILQLALSLPGRSPSEEQIFRGVLGLSGLRIVSSLVAYVVAQLVDIQIYAWLKGITKFRFLWVRSNGSTWISQLIDTILIDLIFLYGGMGMSLQQVWPIMLFSFAYKAFFSVASTPFFYFVVFLVRKRLKHHPKEFL